MLSLSRAVSSYKVTPRDLKCGQYIQQDIVMKSYQNVLQRSEGVTMTAPRNFILHHITVNTFDTLGIFGNSPKLPHTSHLAKCSTLYASQHCTCHSAPYSIFNKWPLPLCGHSTVQSFDVYPLHASIWLRFNMSDQSPALIASRFQIHLQHVP